MPADHPGTLWISRDEAQTWSHPEAAIAGVHPTIVELKDGRLLALSRGAPIDGWMPMSVSNDMGVSWKTTASPFPPITGGQRAVLLRLKEGPILFASFAKDVRRFEPDPKGELSRYVTSLFAAVSYDEGKTWPVRRVISDNKPDHAVFTMDEGRVRMSPVRSEPIGYLTATQSQDGIIHLLSSINHYAFNLGWLKQGQPDLPLDPQPASLASKRILARPFPAARFSASATSGWHAVPATASLPKQWANDRTGEFGNLNPDTGATIEIRASVSGGSAGGGLQFETYVISGPRYLNRYHLRITPSSVVYLEEGRLKPIASGLDNSTTPHTYRIAIRPDTAGQIYRDGKLLATRPAEFGPDQAQAARGSHIGWGATANGINVAVESVAFDLGGAFQP